MSETKVRNQFTRERVQKKLHGESMTQQQFKDECDVNNVVRMFAKTGNITHLNDSEPNYGFCDSASYHESMNLLVEAQQAFEDLPAEVRKKFGHDVGTFLETIENPDNKQMLFDMGIINTNPSRSEDISEASLESGGIQQPQGVSEPSDGSQDSGPTPPKTD